MQPYLIDTHAHIYYAPKFNHDLAGVMARAEAAGVHRIYLPNVDVDTVQPMLDLEEQFPGRCFATLGLHPCEVADDYRQKLATLEPWLAQRPFVAIGEMGTDLYWDKTRLAEQQAAFRIQAGWAKDLGRPLIIHSRESQEHTLELLAELQDGRLFGVQHCFVGGPAQAQRLIDLGFKLGIGGVVTYKNATELHQTVQQIDLEHLVLETDSPYLAPLPHRGRPNEPAYLPLIAQKVAELKNLPLAQVAQATTASALRLFA
jgi:TatD DNase family protein